MNFGDGSAQTPWPNYNNAGFGAYGPYPGQPGFAPGFFGGGGFGPSYGTWAGFPQAWGNQFGYGTFPFGGLGYSPNVGWTPTSDDEIRDFVENAIENDPTVPANTNVDVQVQNGVVTLSGTVPNKRIKHAIGDDAWWLPQVVDVHNEIDVVSRRERAANATSGQSQETGRSSRRAQSNANQAT